MPPSPPYAFEETPNGMDLIVTGQWSDHAADALRRGDADGLVLNYALGFSESDLGFLDGTLPVRRLDVLDRTITDLTPIGRLAHSLEDLSVQAAPGAELDLAALANLRSVAGEWALLHHTLGSVGELESVITWRFDEPDLHAFRDHFGLQRLIVKEAPYLESLSGLAGLTELNQLYVALARSLDDIGEVADVTAVRELKFEDCPGIRTLDEIEPLVELQVLGISNCGAIESLTPLKPLVQLQLLFAWGSTRILDADLSPLTWLPRLHEVRMRDRRGYEPRLSEIVALITSR